MAQVGGCPWHLREAYASTAALAARTRAEERMRAVILETKEAKDAAMQKADGVLPGARTVTAAIGRRVVCTGKGGKEARGLYQRDGRILEDGSRRAMRLTEFAALAGCGGGKAARCLKAILLEVATTMLPLQRPPFHLACVCIYIYIWVVNMYHAYV